MAKDLVRSIMSTDDVVTRYTHAYTDPEIAPAKSIRSLLKGSSNKDHAMHVTRLSSLLCALVLSGSAYAAKCKDAFDDYKIGNFEKLGDRAFKAPIRIDVDASVSSKLYATALENFNRELDMDWLKSAVKEMRDSGKATGETITRLKAMRKHASVIRSMFTAFSSDNKVPAALSDYTKDFGKLNDALAADNKGLVRGTAKTFLKALDAKALRKATESFRPAPRAEVESFLSEQLQEAVQTIDEKYISIQTLHDVRKALKDFLAIYTLLPATAESNEVRQYLTELNEEFGKINDDVTLADLAGDLKYKKTQVRIYKAVRSAVTNFSHQVEFVQ